MPSLDAAASSCGLSLGGLRDRLDREGVSYLYLDGRTRDCREKLETFQSDAECQFFLISLNAGGLGLHSTLLELSK